MWSVNPSWSALLLTFTWLTLYNFILFTSEALGCSWGRLPYFFSALCSNVTFISEPPCNHHSEKCFCLYGNFLLHFFFFYHTYYSYMTHCVLYLLITIIFYCQSLLLNYILQKDRNFCLFCSLLYFHYFNDPWDLVLKNWLLTE